MAPREVLDRDFEAEVLNADQPVLVAFFNKAWKEPCRNFEAVLRELERDFHVELKRVRIDLERTPELKERYQVISAPTLLVLEKGQVVAEIRGSREAGDLRSRLGDYFNSRTNWAQA